MSENYICFTQRGEEPTLAASPSSQPNLPSIVVGYSSVIPRWSTSSGIPTVLYWFLEARTFPDEEEANFAASALNEAAAEWNNVNFGVTVYQTTDKKQANFNLLYRKKCSEKGTLAYSFLPGQPPMNIVVLQYGMSAPYRSTLKNTFVHELGHVFGLRHEFAVEKEQYGAQQWSLSNMRSVMSYQPAPKIQATDRAGIRTFYQLPNRHQIGEIPIKDYDPELLNID